MTARHSWKKSAAKLTLFALLGHFPVCAAAAYFFHSSVWTALGLTLLIVAARAPPYASPAGSRFCAVMLAIGTMGLSALLIHISHGMIEMHFHILVGMAVLILLGEWRAIVAAGATAAVHHTLFWLWLPSSVFNYQAGFAVVVLH